MYFLGINAAGA